eukprot:TRINITY_DN4167_c0_g1_i1.p1 TRINITY_DN4167_c0_g1~~TRINITY_DN4167_c0_g1_i1.p1  ORF type:complete len:1079 (-),score=142.05 TRINITY_DN4167_c0_g1_i1:102-3338(-)
MYVWSWQVVLGSALLLASLASCQLTAPLCQNRSGGRTCGTALLQHGGRVHMQVSSALGGTISAAEGCGNGTHCVVPAGEQWLLDASIDVETLTIFGQLSWATDVGGLELRAGYVLVEDGGRFEVGSSTAPMRLQATIYIKDTIHNHTELGRRFLGGVGNSVIVIHGRYLSRTWSLLSETVAPGTSMLSLKHNPAEMGWQPGDRVGVATTSLSNSTTHTITKVGQNWIELGEPVQFEHWGGHREVGGRRFEMAAEVVNLERSVVITGSHEDIDTTMEGLHTIITGSGFMDIRYARVEHCGQRFVMGRYCMHFHLMGQCPLCVFQGNAAVDSQQIGIAMHGTHRSTVDENIVWDARGPGIFTEDGNEMNNSIRRNVVICSSPGLCGTDWVSGSATEVAGIFAIGMSNDFLENRVAGHENGFWTPGASRGLGFGKAIGKVCPAHAPFGKVQDNVWHDNHRFGLYLDNQNPRRLLRDSNGYVTDMKSCAPFTPDGRDNGLVNEIWNDFNWHNQFVGQYAMGDIQFINYTSVNNAHAMYWKTSKNFADGRLWHVVDSFFANDPSDSYGSLQFLGPSGPFTFGMKNSVFFGDRVGVHGALAAGQNCKLGGAGGPCNVQYLLEGVDFSGVTLSNSLIGFGAHAGDEAYVLPMFVSRDSSLGGYRSVVSRHLDGFGQVPGCTKLGVRWNYGYGCNSVIRRFNIWGVDVGILTLSGPGYSVEANRSVPIDGRNAGEMQFDVQHSGYGAPVLEGQRYILTGNFSAASTDDLILEFSDDVLANFFGSPESMWLQVGENSCELHSSGDRSFLMAYGRGYMGVEQFTTLQTHSLIRNGKLICDRSEPEPVTPATSSVSIATTRASETTTTAINALGETVSSTMTETEATTTTMTTVRTSTATAATTATMTSETTMMETTTTTMTTIATTTKTTTTTAVTTSISTSVSSTSSSGSRSRPGTTLHTTAGVTTTTGQGTTDGGSEDCDDDEEDDEDEDDDNGDTDGEDDDDDDEDDEDDDHGSLNSKGKGRGSVAHLTREQEKHLASSRQWAKRLMRWSRRRQKCKSRRRHHPQAGPLGMGWLWNWPRWATPWR